MRMVPWSELLLVERDAEPRREYLRIAQKRCPKIAVTTSRSQGRAVLDVVRQEFSGEVVVLTKLPCFQESRPADDPRVWQELSDWLAQFGDLAGVDLETALTPYRRGEEDLDISVFSTALKQCASCFRHFYVHGIGLWPGFEGRDSILLATCFSPTAPTSLRPFDGMLTEPDQRPWEPLYNEWQRSLYGQGTRWVRKINVSSQSEYDKGYLYTRGWPPALFLDKLSWCSEQVFCYRGLNEWIRELDGEMARRGV